ncbi:MAG: hypothetical protein V2A76_02080, partial [Planctomycetota bacterium]
KRGRSNARLLGPEEAGGSGVSDEWDDDLTETIRCSSCGEDVYEDAVVCPACNEYVSHRNHALAGRPIWFILLGVAGLAALIWMLVVS